ncbi:heat shock factor 2-binding protein-like [Scleropages formosus]|uniref:Heat shock factor 2-binding protein-like n=1 Tax=Scleropages formosus TaxID=113540 RepID=A0A0P7X3R5_SCLFO|nr:heat shock factor 2-binding protein-like [Scleropages formosus]
MLIGGHGCDLRSFMAVWYPPQGGFVRVRKRDLERLTTEVMQLRDFLPKVISRDVLEKVRQGHVVDVVKERIELEREQLQQDYLHLCSRLDAAHCECQREREEKLALRQQLWVSQEQLQQQAEFCTTLGVASCTLLWSVSSKEEVIKDILADRKAEAFLAVAAQTLESFVGQSLDREGKVEQQTSSQEMQFVLALAGIVTNIAAVTCGRDFLSSSAHMLLDTLMQLLGVMKPGVFSKLKVDVPFDETCDAERLMLMALYNVSISIKGLKYISESSCLLQLLPSLLQGRISASRNPILRQAAEEMLDHLAALGGPWRDTLNGMDKKGPSQRIHREADGESERSSRERCGGGGGQQHLDWLDPHSRTLAGLEGHPHGASARGRQAQVLTAGCRLPDIGLNSRRARLPGIVGTGGEQ